MGLFKNSHAEALREIREPGFTGPVDSDGDAVMSRTTPDGRAMYLTDKGASGYGTPDEERASRLPRR